MARSCKVTWLRPVGAVERTQPDPRLQRVGAGLREGHGAPADVKPRGPSRRPRLQAAAPRLRPRQIDRWDLRRARAARQPLRHRARPWPPGLPIRDLSKGALAGGLLPHLSRGGWQPRPCCDSPHPAWQGHGPLMCEVGQGLGAEQRGVPSPPAGPSGARLACPPSLGGARSPVPVSPYPWA